MLTHIAIRNFQSLRQVDLELGTFTVIVGPSSSGKSALMRAFKAVASNVRGSGMITRGQSQMAISYQTDTFTVTLERTEKAGLYRIANTHGGETNFTKLNGEVPQQVTSALRLEPVPVNGTSVNFASQFDKPYLLDESGATVARVLGELTNVDTIFEAVRSANKIRLSAAATLKTRKADLAGLRERLGEFQGLTDRLTLLADVEKLSEQLSDLQARITRLDSALRTLAIAQRALDKVIVPDVPSPDRLNEALARYTGLKAKTRALAATHDRLRTQKDEVVALANGTDHLEGELAAKLREAGICPTCGRATV